MTAVRMEVLWTTRMHLAAHSHQRQRTVDLVALCHEKLCEVGTILTRDSCERRKGKSSQTVDVVSHP